MRGLSQTLHPSILEELGLESTIDWYLSTVEKQLGIQVAYERSGPAVAVDATTGDPCLPRAAGGREQRGAACRRDTRLGPAALRCCRTRARGRRIAARGLEPDSARRGLGLVAMRERAELLGGTIEFLKPHDGGTLVRLSVPMPPSGNILMTPTITVLLVDDHALVRRGFRRLLEDDPSIAVVGEASNGEEAIRLVAGVEAGRRGDGCGDAGHRRAGRHARDSRPAIRRRRS